MVAVGGVREGWSGGKGLADTSRNPKLCALLFAKKGAVGAAVLAIDKMSIRLRPNVFLHLFTDVRICLLFVFVLCLNDIFGLFNTADHIK